MSTVIYQIAMSLDGFVSRAQPEPRQPARRGWHPLARLGDRASWREQHGRRVPPNVTAARTVDDDVLDAVNADVGAHITGRKMFGGGDGPWDESWQGWRGGSAVPHADVRPHPPSDDLDVAEVHAWVEGLEALHAHTTLAMLAHAFLTVTRARTLEKGGDDRRRPTN